MERKKITIGIDVEPHIKKKIAQVIAQWADAPVKWHAVDGVHVPLVSIGWVGEDDVPAIIDAVCDAAAQTAMCDVVFTRIAAAHKDPHVTDAAQYNIVRMEGEVSEPLRLLHERLYHALQMPVTSKKQFRPYVTIGQMRVAQWRADAQRPQIDVPVRLVMDVTHVSVLEHLADDDGGTFVPIEVVPLAASYSSSPDA